MLLLVFVFTSSWTRSIDSLWIDPGPDHTMCSTYLGNSGCMRKERWECPLLSPWKLILSLQWSAFSLLWLLQSGQAAPPLIPEVMPAAFSGCADPGCLSACWMLLGCRCQVHSPNAYQRARHMEVIQLKLVKWINRETNLTLKKEHLSLPL